MSESASLSADAIWTIRIARVSSWAVLMGTLWISWRSIPFVLDLDGSFYQPSGPEPQTVIHFADYANDWGKIVIRYHALFVAVSFALPVASVAATFFLKPVPRFVFLIVLMGLTSYIAHYVIRAIGSSM